ncbi:peptidylprolyl isomerase [Altererythrobacter aerius]|uniref:Parvulin-like PPIase n=2 Tax=Tsuneonella aeria TaxID=1837929 RepID=A0A6I4TAD8_9SPHN|nr:peptidylprolyl isomerase [Tsuneonella aeria]MXO74489.1 peptidylprolyl isomerase [Tsuneonella aeria]
MAVVASPIAAQTAAQPADPAAQATTPSITGALDIPADVAILGKNDPNSRKPTAVVNGQIVTGTDVDQRVALIVAASRSEIEPAELQRLRMQVLRNLIDESLQIQEARAQQIEVSQAEVDQTYARVAAQNFGQNVEAMDAYLTRIGSSSNSLKRQILGELSWQRLLRRNVAPFVNVSAEEVNEMLQRLEASRGTEEYRLGEIWLSATPENAAQVEANINQIIEQLRGGGSFLGYARQYSQSSTAAAGGDLGFVRLEMLPSELAVAARQMQPGQLVGPIANSGGYSILYLIDKRAVLTSDARDAVLSLKQISLKFEPGITESQAQAKLATFTTTVQAMKGCGDADNRAQAIGAEVVSNDGIVLRSLPEQLQPLLMELQVGQTTPPFGSARDGVSVLMLCGRDDPQATGAPDFDDLMSQLEDDRVNKRAQRYMRDLRNDAVIEYN